MGTHRSDNRDDNDRPILKLQIDKTKTKASRASTLCLLSLFFENFYKLRLINSKSKSMENAFEMRVFAIQIFQLCPRIYAISSHNGIKPIDVNERNFLDVAEKKYHFIRRICY